MAHLVIVDPKGAEQQVTLEAAEVVIGRDPSVQIALQDRKVSRRHARVFAKNGTYWVEDLGSANGVLVEGRPITAARKLSAGMRFEIGGHGFVFADDPAAAAATRFALLGRNGPYANQSFLLPAGELGVGRVDGNAIIIPDVSVSRKHAVLHTSANGIVVEDLDSSNGSWVNGVRVGRRELALGDRVRFGNIEFELASSQPGAGLANVARLGTRFRRADRTVQIAVVIGILCVVLLGVTIVVAVNRGPRKPGPARPNPTHASSAEEAYERALAADIAAARQAMGNSAWEEAAQAFRRVLDRDPINRDARRGLLAAEASHRDQQLLDSARALLQANQPLDALSRLRAMSPESHYAAAAREVAEAAKGRISTAALETARQACQRSEWRDCHRDAIRVLENTPDSVAGQALVSQAEDALRSRRIAFTPWAPPKDRGTAQSPSLEAMYRDDELRFAVLRYAAGDLDGAVKKIQTLPDKAGAAAVNESLAEFRRAKTAGDGAAVAGDLPRAIRAWEEALAADGKIVPDNHPSAFRDEVRRRLSRELWKQGDGAFGRGNYAEAYTAWSRGLSYNAADADLLAAIAKLEARAQAMLADVPGRGPLRKDGCGKLRDILAMTRPGAAVHEDAAKREKAGCN
jgi:pSer/pThr/pTyr-binding forkhead associated (FHA) protein/tetratricopeptide (TPR) repeat protein